MMQQNSFLNTLKITKSVIHLTVPNDLVNLIKSVWMSALQNYSQTRETFHTKELVSNTSTENLPELRTAGQIIIGYLLAY